jgi:hypothetical protein
LGRRGRGNRGWRELHNEISDLYSSPNIVHVIKSRRMRWVEQVARMGERGRVDRALVGKPEGNKPLVSARRSGRIIVNG